MLFGSWAVPSVFWLFLFFIAPSCIFPVVAQGFTVPSQWRKPTSNLTKADREGLARDAADLLVPLIDISTGKIDSLNFSLQDVNLVAVLALQDWHSGNTTYKDTVVGCIQAYPAAHNNSFYASISPRTNSEEIQWGITAFYAYRAYKDPSLLDIANASWTQVSQYLVTTDAAKSGTQTTRNVTIPSQCTPAQGNSEVSVEGAVFWDVDVKNDLTVDTDTIGPFMALSAYLYEITSDDIYKTAADLTGQFVLHYLYNNTIVFNNADLATCGIDTTAIISNTGYVIEAVSVWADVSPVGSAFASWLKNLVPTAIQFNGWTGSDGVIFEAPVDPDSNWQHELKAVFIRGLLEARNRNLGSDMANLIESFITVQLNSILDSATTVGSNIYASVWTGPSDTTLHPEGNIAALDVLNAAFTLVNATSTSGSPPSTTSPSSSRNSSSDHSGIIAGAVIGGVFGIAALIFCIVFLLRRRRRQRATHRGSLVDVASSKRTSEHGVEPFPMDALPTLEPSFYPVSLPGGGTHLKLQHAWEVPMPRQTSSSSSAPGTVIASTLSGRNSGLASSRSQSVVHALQDRPEDSYGIDVRAISGLVRVLNGILRVPQDEDAHRDEPPPQYYTRETDRHRDSLP